MNNEDKEAFEKWFGDDFITNEEGSNVTDYCRDYALGAWMHKQKEIDELAYFKAIYHSLIDGAARDTEKINKLQAEIELLDNEDMLRIHMNSVGYKNLKKLQFENKKLIEENNILSGEILTYKKMSDDAFKKLAVAVEALEFYRDICGGVKAREALKELGEK